MLNLAKFYKNKKVLITGDTGFKGSWLAIWLLEMGATIYGYALPPKTKQDNYVKTKLSEKIEHHTGDIRNLDKLNRFLSDKKPEILFHLAAQPLILSSYSDPIYTIETNIVGTANVLDAVRQNDSVRVLINVTTDKVYENKNWVWGYRETDRLGGSDPYSASKTCSEIITQSYRKSFFNKDGDCQIATARAGNVIGAGDWGEYRIVPDFFRAMLNKKVLIIRNPEATRPWQHVLEPLYGYLLLANKLYEKSGQYEMSWNFGPDVKNEYTVFKLIESISNITNYNRYSVAAENQIQKESKYLKLDSSKSLSELFWKFVWNFTDTVHHTATGYISDYNGVDSFTNRQKTIKKFINAIIS